MSNGPEFFRTRMGQEFYDGRVPKIASALERIASALEQLVGQAHEDVPERHPAMVAAAAGALGMDDTLRTPEGQIVWTPAKREAFRLMIEVAVAVADDDGGRERAKALRALRLLAGAENLAGESYSADLAPRPREEDL